MELRVLRYFLAVAREESVTAAAERLNITQPTLSRQLLDLEEELGVRLFNRGRRSRRITLTEEGMFLRKHAEEIVLIADKTEAAFSSPAESITGDIYVAAGETDAIRLLARAAQAIQKEHPRITVHVASGDGIFVQEELAKGVADFGVMLGSVDPAEYDYLTLPVKDVWGILMRRDSPLAVKDSIRAEDLWDKPLILSRGVAKGTILLNWLKKELSELNVVGTHSLVYNSALMTEEGMGYTLTLDKLVNTSGDSPLCFRPLAPRMETEIYLVWKKYQMFSKAAALFLARLRQMVEDQL